MKKCVFFDRDGIVNRSPGDGYVERWEDLHLQPEFVDAARQAAAHGYEAAIITNQRCVALGVVSFATITDMHRRLEKLLSEKHGINLLGVYCCPHDRDECDCRKPKPGLLLQAAEEHDIDLSASWMIGDQPRDVEAGKAAGCRTILVGSIEKHSGADLTVPDMKELQRVIAKVL